MAEWWEKQRAALVIAHPGHELRLHHWLERARPLAFILTDGSGHTDRSRIRSTSAALARAGARQGPIYGALSDRDLYQAVLAGRRETFARLVDALALALQRENVDYVVGDAVEGFNPGHDICRLLLNAALMRIGPVGGDRPRNLEFAVNGPPECPAEDRADAIVLALDDDAYRRKIEALRAYPEMAAEAERLLGDHGEAAFRTECLRPVHYGLEIASRFAHPCFYESYGEKQVAAGFYGQVIRFREHIAPLASYLGAQRRAGT